MLRSGTGRVIEGTSVSRPTKATDNVVWVVVTRRACGERGRSCETLLLAARPALSLRLPRVVPPHRCRRHRSERGSLATAHARHDVHAALKSISYSTGSLKFLSSIDATSLRSRLNLPTPAPFDDERSPLQSCHLVSLVCLNISGVRHTHECPTAWAPRDNPAQVVPCRSSELNLPFSC